MIEDDYGDLFEHRHLAHSPGLPTESMALSKVIPSITPMKERILEELSVAKDEGLTPDEYAEEHGNLINTVRRRFTDLWKEGKIRHHPEGLTRPNSDKNECIVWILGSDTNAPESTESRIRQLRSQLRSHGIIPCA